jgi:phage repressor protein C with HTH and peptisase S24 domain
MEPRLFEGDRVIIDVSQNAWVADAIYAIDDGDTNLQIKTIRKVTSSVPPVFRIVSENPPGDEVQRRHDEFRIVGRVVGRISRP